ncbi:MAG: restriction endonuclease [Candidatus Methanomethylicaceae archaeon]
MKLEELENKLKLGESLEEILKKEGWKDFEDLTSLILSENGFLTIKNFRFSYNKKRYEIDIIALEEPRAILIDCKHWKARYGKKSALRKAAHTHYQKCLNFSYKLSEIPIIELKKWNKVIIIPTLITLYEEELREEEKVLIVPLFKIVSFLECVRNGFFDMIKLKFFKLS